VSKRIVVTGLGCVTPIGLDVRSTWDAMVAGRSGVGPINGFDASALSTRIAAEVDGFDPTRYVGPKEARRMDRFVQLGLAAAVEAFHDAELTVDASNAERIGVVGGSGIGGIGVLSQQFEVLFTKGPDRVSPFLIPMLIMDMLAGQISITLGMKGPNFGVVSACATSGHAIGEAAEVIKRCDADVMIAGGSEAGVVPIGVAAFGAMRALSTRNDEPLRASRPFDAQRDGFVIGEGGGMVVLESLEHARARGARIYAELVGYGATGDAYHVSAPSEGGEGAARAMNIALRKADLSPRDVDYINAHGTSTPYNDRAETDAIKAAFGPAAYDVAVSSTKSVTGHLMGAAGAVELIACIKAITLGILPPTVNYEYPDPACDLDYVPNRARQRKVDVALSNSLGFGGHNSTLVVAAFRG
jgi:3-oxoacyl-[acyl-carrier-protein] synthase II